MIVVFLLGYLLITMEEVLHINKSAFALITGIVLWVVAVVMSPIGLDSSALHHAIEGQVAEIAQILFFLLGAMVIVELIDAHGGFEVVSDLIQTKSLVGLLWIVGIVTFFLSAALDNLTTAIVMVSLLRKLIKNQEVRALFAGVVIILANAGGAWSPIGDVTTTMLWIGGQVSASGIMKALIAPSLVAGIVPLIWVSLVLKQQKSAACLEPMTKDRHPTKGRGLVLTLGLGGVLFVPVFKILTHLPPMMGMLLVLGILWMVTELLHRKSDFEARKKYTAAYALSRIDSSSILFFMGILLAVGALGQVGLLSQLAKALENHLPDLRFVAVATGLLSAIIDNVPLVAALIQMYDLTQFPQDHYFWEFVAFTAGTGGSALIIGSAPGVAVMGLEGLSFGWYLRKMTLPALLGFAAGCGVYLLEL